MPVNKHIGNLWFETKEEMDRYDDLMVSNIELKETDSESSNFTVVSLREKKEIVTKPSDRTNEQMEKYSEFMMNETPAKTSLSSFWEWPIYKYYFGVLGSYLIIRELPIRNFYARSFIMAIYLLHLRRIFKYNGYGEGFQSNLVFIYDNNFM